jgi:hypothetical protein
VIDGMVSTLEDKVILIAIGGLVCALALGIGVLIRMYFINSK